MQAARMSACADSAEKSQFVKALDVANYFIARANADDEIGENITNLKLQKLVYYAQGFSLALRGQPLFDEPILAWEHGPVVRALYDVFKVHGAKPIPKADTITLTPDVEDLLSEIYEVYGQYSAVGLRNLTHDEPPWRDTPRNGEISLDAMRAYFADRVRHGA